MINFIQITEENARNMYFSIIENHIKKGRELRKYQLENNYLNKNNEDYIDVEYEILNK